MTFGTVPVFTGMIHIVFMAAIIALKDMSSHDFRTAMKNVIKGALVTGEHVLAVGFYILIAIKAKDVGQFRHDKDSIRY
jgi:glycine/serine hydroxymethyltransferase